MAIKEEANKLPVPELQDGILPYEYFLAFSKIISRFMREFTDEKLKEFAK